MSEPESVTSWLEKLKADRPDAAQEIWARYVEQLVRLASRKLGDLPRRAVDEEDVVLSAFRGFLQGVEDQRFAQLNDRNDLWQVLVMLTERRAIAIRRHEGALKRGGGDVRGESVFVRRVDHGSQKHGLHQVPARDAAPEFAVEMTGRLRELLSQLSDDTQRKIALGKLEGKTNKELSVSLGINLRSVERKLALIRDKWRGEYDDE